MDELNNKENRDDKSDSKKNQDVKSKKSVPAAKEKKPGFFIRVAQYFRELKAEIKKVVWPTRKQVIHNTIVVLVMMLFSGAIIWLLDLMFGQARDFVIKFMGGE